jgi:hypothetical protein
VEVRALARILVSYFSSLCRNSDCTDPGHDDVLPGPLI